MTKYDATEVILSIIYYSGGSYSPDEITQIIETIALYQPEVTTEKRSSAGLRIVPINTNEYAFDD
jgi:hypothetical protein